MAQPHKTAEVEDLKGHCVESETAQMERNKRKKQRPEKEFDFLENGNRRKTKNESDF